MSPGPHYRVDCVHRLDEAFFGVDAVGLGAVPAHLPTPDLFVQVWRDTDPFLRLELYGELLPAFRAEVLCGHVVTATATDLHVVGLDPRRIVHRPKVGLSQVFCLEDACLGCCDQEIFRLDLDGSYRWRRAADHVRVILLGHEEALLQASWTGEPSAYFCIDLESGALREETL